jgi:hypothetical protein
LNVFLDSSVVLAACGRATGASRAVFDTGGERGWVLQTSSYVLGEVERNISNLPPAAAKVWIELRAKLVVVPDVVTLAWISVVPATKDRPILFTAFAWSDVLLTLDRRDLGDVLGSDFYGLRVMKPGDFLSLERAAGRYAP